jgi:asparaginyl-tRNA synthetase
VTDVYVDRLGDYVGGDVTLKGWVYHLRSSGKIKFLVLRDGTGLVQCVVVPAEAEQAFEQFSRLTQESSLAVTGTVQQDARAPGGYELLVKNLEIIHVAEPYPITPKEHGVSFLMDHRHLWLRSSRQHAILRVRAEVMRACRDFLDDRGFIELDSPILTPSAAEGTTTLFETDYFDSKAYLSQSGQLYNEATCMAFGRVYCLGPTFRAEKSKTRRHLTEFWMVEPEMAFAGLEDMMQVSEEMIAFVVERVLARRAGDLDVLERDPGLLRNVTHPFPRISYEDALNKLEGKGLQVARGEDLGAEEETALSSEYDRPVFVHRYPVKAKAFYMQPDPEDPDLALCADMLAPEGYGEIVGGSERIYDLDLLRQRIREFNLPEEAFEWYLDLRKYGSVPHSGFGIGIERLVGWICGIKHIREAIPFPRLINRAYP